MIAPNPTSKVPHPETGVEATMLMIEALFGPILRTPGNRWQARLERRGVPVCDFPGDKPLAMDARTMEEVRALVTQYAPHVEQRGEGVPTVDTTLTIIDYGVRSDRRELVLCFQVDIDLRELFRESGPLHDVTIVRSDGEIDPRRLTAGHFSAAETFLDSHLANHPFRPTIVLDGDWRWRLIYVLEQPRVTTPQLLDRLAEISHEVSRLIHGGYRAESRGLLRLPFLNVNPREKTWRLRYVKPDRRFDHEAVMATITRIKHAPDDGKLIAPKFPLAMRLRTLPEDWDLADLEVPDDVRQMLANGGGVRGRLILDRLVPIVQAMALRGHGWFDVEVVLADPRLGLMSAFRADPALRGGLRRLFATALAKRPIAYAPRLPHGIQRLFEIPSLDPGDLRRFIVRCGPRRSPVEVEVTFDVLVTASRFRLVLGNRIAKLPYSVPSAVWQEAIQLGLRDPRIAGRLKPGARASKPVSALLAEYTAKATDWVPPRANREDPLAWPLLHNGLFVFPLSDVQKFIASRTLGTRVGRDAVAAAIRAAGGDNHGPMRFGRRLVRCWQMPYSFVAPANAD